MSFIKTIENIRGIEWATTYLWDIKFDDAPKPFNAFFPAIDIEEPLATLEPYRFSGYMSQYKVPKSTVGHILRVTFYDSFEFPIKKWLTEWIEYDILNVDSKNQKHIGYLEDVVKTVHVQKMDSNRNLISSSSYWVFPEGTISFIGNSSSEISTATVNFVIAGSVHK